MKELAVAFALAASSLAACSGSDSYYVYPSDYSNELEYVCLHVMQRGTRRFMVNDQHAVIPLQAAGSGVLPEVQTDLAPLDDVDLLPRAAPKRSVVCRR